MTKPKAVARFAGVKESDLRAVKLAHPLSAEAKQRLGLPEDSAANVNDEIKVRDSDARSLIGAGYAQVDPEDAPAVAEALGEPAPGETTGNRHTTDSK